MAARELAVIITGDVRRIRAALGDLGSDLDRAARGFDNGGRSADGWAGKVQKGAKVGAEALLIFGAAAATAGAKFEQQMSAVEAVSGATVDQMDQLSDKALQLGADTVYSATESGSAMEELVKAGLSVEDVLNGAADATVALAAAGGVELPEAATIASNALNAFKLSAEDLPRIADVIAGAANTSAIDVTEFGQSMQQASAVANLVGLSFEDTATAIGLLGDAGIRGSDAGTSLKTMLTRLTPQTAAQAKAMRELGLLTEDGSSKFYDQEGRLRSLAEIAQILQQQLGGLGDEKLQQGLYDLFGSDALRAGAILFGEGAAGALEFRDAMTAIGAEDVAETRLDNLLGSVERLKGAAESFLISSSGGLNKGLRELVDTGTAAIEWMTDPPTELTDWLSSTGETIRSNVVPIWEDLVDAGENVVDLGSSLVSELRPAGEVIAGLAGGAVVVTLRVTADVLERVTGLIADNRQLLVAGVAAWAAWKAGAAGAAAWTAISAGASAAAGSITYLVGAIQSLAATRGISTFAAATQVATTSITGFATASVSSAAIAGGALAGLAVGASLAYMTIQRSEQNAKKAADEFVESLDVDPSSTDSLLDGLNAINQETQRLLEISEQSNWKELGQNLNPWADNEISEAAAEIDELSEASERYYDQSMKLYDVADRTGLSGDAVSAWVKKLDFDPATDSAYDMAEAINDATRMAELGSPRTENLAESYAVLADETSSATDQLEAWSDALDAIIGVPIDAANAIDQWALAIPELTTNLRDLGGDLDGTSTKAAESRIALRDMVSQAIEGATAIGEQDGIDAATWALESFRQQLIDAAAEAGISRAEIEAQLDAIGFNTPTIVAQMELEGVDATNAAVSATTRPRTVEVTTIADAASRATAERYIGQTSRPRRAVLLAQLDPASRATAERYIDQAAHDRYATIYLRLDPASRAMADRYMGQARLQYEQGRNAGGLIYGPNVDRDVVPAMLTPGEYVIRKDAVKALGIDTLDMLNRGRLPGFSAGGRVYEDEPGWNWQTMGNGMAGPAIAAMYPDGLIAPRVSASSAEARRTATSIPGGSVIYLEATVEVDGVAIGRSRSVYRGLADQKRHDERAGR